MVVALRAAARSQTVFVEQPEIHLHPRAQVALATIIAHAIDRGVQVIAETHSDLMILAMMCLVAEGKLKHTDVALHWVTRDSHGATSIQTAEVDDRGRFGDWPSDFGDVRMNLESRYIDASVR